MGELSLVVGALIVGGLILSWTLSRIERLAVPLALVNLLVQRVGVSVIAAVAAAQAATKGGPWLLLAALCGALALLGFAFAGLIVWGVTTGKFDESEQK